MFIIMSGKKVGHEKSCLLWAGKESFIVDGKRVFIILGGKRVSTIVCGKRVYIIMGGKRVFYCGLEKSVLLHEVKECLSLWAGKECFIEVGGKRVFYCGWERCFLGTDVISQQLSLGRFASG